MLSAKRFEQLVGEFGYANCRAQFISNNEEYTVAQNFWYDEVQQEIYGLNYEIHEFELDVELHNDSCMYKIYEHICSQHERLTAMLAG